MTWRRWSGPMFSAGVYIQTGDDEVAFRPKERPDQALARVYAEALETGIDIDGPQGPEHREPALFQRVCLIR